MGVPAKLPFMHIMDAYFGAAMPRADSRPSTRVLSTVVDLGAEPAFPFLHSSEWGEND